MAKTRVNLAAAPLSATVLTAKRFRLVTRWRENLVLMGVMAIVFGSAAWFGVSRSELEYGALAKAIAVLLALALLGAGESLRLNHCARAGLQPASEPQLQQVMAVRWNPLVDSYVQAVAAIGRPLTRGEASTIIAYGCAQLTKRDSAEPTR